MMARKTQHSHQNLLRQIENDEIRDKRIREAREFINRPRVHGARVLPSIGR